MTTREQEENKTKVAAAIFGGVLAAVAGPIGIWVAASAVAIQQALFPNVGENDERREERRHEAELDKGARRANRLARHQARLDAIAAQDRAYRQRRRDYLTNGGDEPYRYALDRNGDTIMVDGKPKRAGFWSRMKQAARKRAARGVLAAARAHEGYVTEREEAKKRREAGEPVVKPAVAGLYGAALGYLGAKATRSPEAAEANKTAEPSNPTPGPTETGRAPVTKADHKRSDPAGRPEENPQPQSPATSPTDVTPAAPTDPRLQQAVDWYAAGNAPSHPGPSEDTPAARAVETKSANGGKQMGGTATAQVPAGQPATPPTGEANVELVNADLGTAAAALTRMQELLGEINAERGRLKAASASARGRGEVNGAQQPVLQALEAFDAAADQLGALVDASSDVTTHAEDQGGAARTSLQPTLNALDDLRANGGSGDMAATAKAD